MFLSLQNWRNSSAPRSKRAVTIRRAKSFGKRCGCSKNTTKQGLLGLLNSVRNSANVRNRLTAASMLALLKPASGSSGNPNSAENPRRERVYSQRRCRPGFGRYLGIHRSGQPRRCRPLDRKTVDAFEAIGQAPGIGHKREDLTNRPYRSFRWGPISSFLIVYRGTRKPLEIVAITQGSRDIPSFLRRRLI